MKNCTQWRNAVNAATIKKSLKPPYILKRLLENLTELHFIFILYCRYPPLDDITKNHKITLLIFTSADTRTLNSPFRVIKFVNTQYTHRCLHATCAHEYTRVRHVCFLT